MARFNVVAEGPNGELASWTGEAEESGHAVDLAKELLGDDITILEVEVED